MNECSSLGSSRVKRPVHMQHHRISRLGIRLGCCVEWQAGIVGNGWHPRTLGIPTRNISNIHVYNASKAPISIESIPDAFPLFASEDFTRNFTPPLSIDLQWKDISGYSCRFPDPALPVPSCSVPGAIHTTQVQGRKEGMSSTILHVQNYGRDLPPAGPGGVSRSSLNIAKAFLHLVRACLAPKFPNSWTISVSIKCLCYLRGHPLEPSTYLATKATESLIHALRAQLLRT
jgi:hypothetical protein